MRLWRPLQRIIPYLVLAPSVLAIFVFFYAFVAFTFYLSLTNSHILPSYSFVGFGNYARIWGLQNWLGAVRNLLIFGFLYIAISYVLALILAILIDQKLRGLRSIHPVFIYPMAMSFIIAGTAWKWLLDPAIGLQDNMRVWGFSGFTLQWIKDHNFATYCVVIAAVWQSTGLIMALFLASMNRIDNDLIKAAQLDGASTSMIYSRVVIPMMRPVLVAAVAMLGFLAVTTYDLVVALTDGGPGRSTQLPAAFMYSYSFSRNEMALGAAASILMTLCTIALALPLLISGKRGRYI